MKKLHIIYCGDHPLLSQAFAQCHTVLPGFNATAACNEMDEAPFAATAAHVNRYDVEKQHNLVNTLKRFLEQFADAIRTTKKPDEREKLEKRKGDVEARLDAAKKVFAEMTAYVTRFLKKLNDMHKVITDAEKHGIAKDKIERLKEQYNDAYRSYYNTAYYSL